jgi:acylphosphatase
VSFVQLKIFGWVQGVNYRYYTFQKARELGLKGYVSNLADGSVEVTACGERDKLEELIEFCRNNPGYSHVERVEIEWCSEGGEEFEGFDVV